MPNFLTRILRLGQDGSSSLGFTQGLLRWGLYLVLAALPLVFSAGTAETVHLPKQHFLAVAVATLLALWLLEALLAHRLALRGPWWGYLALGVFVLITGAATLLSQDYWSSLFGQYGRLDGGLVSVVSFSLLTLLLIEGAHNWARTLSAYWTSFAIGVLLAAALALFQLNGVHLLSWDFAQQGNWNTLGMPPSLLAALLALLLPWLLAWLGIARGWRRLLTWFTGAVTLIALVALDADRAWLLALISSALLIAFLVWRNEEEPTSRVGLTASALLVISLLLWVMPVARWLRVSLPVEVDLSAGASRQIAQQSLPGHWLLGTGPETFRFGFSKFKPEQLNATNFWSVRFDRAAGQYVQQLVATGLLGLVSFAVLLFGALILVGRQLWRDRSDRWPWHLAALSGLVSLAVLLASVSFSTVLQAAFWLTLASAGISISATRPVREWAMAKSPRAALIASFLFLVGLSLAATVWYLAGRSYLADAAYAQALRTAAAPNQLDSVEQRLVDAVNGNPFREQYRLTLAQAKLAQANRIVQEAQAKGKDAKPDLDQVRQYISAAIATARSAAAISPNSVTNWEALAGIYQSSALFAGGAEDLMVQAFDQAVALEPANPGLYTELAKAYLAAAQQRLQAVQQLAKEPDRQKVAQDQSKALIDKAEENLKKAVEKKADYWPAHFQQAVVFEMRGDNDKAIQQLLAINQQLPNDLNVLQELGALFFDKPNYDRASEVYERILQLVPNHAQARLALSAVYEKQQKKDLAIQEMEKLVEQNPDNQQLKARLEALKQGASSSAPSANANKSKR